MQEEAVVVVVVVAAARGELALGRVDCQEQVAVDGNLLRGLYYFAAAAVAAALTVAGCRFEMAVGTIQGQWWRSQTLLGTGDSSE